MTPLALLGIAKELGALAVKHWRLLLVLAVLTGCALGGWYARGWKADRDIADLRGQIAAAQAGAANVAKEAERQAREKERQHAAAILAITTKHREEMSHAKQEHDRVVSDYRAGNLRLRERFTCSAPAGGASTATAHPDWLDGTPQGGLSDADVEFLIQFATDADEVAISLSTCQATLAADRAAIGQPISN